MYNGKISSAKIKLAALYVDRAHWQGNYAFWWGVEHFMEWGIESHLAVAMSGRACETAVVVVGGVVYEVPVGAIAMVGAAAAESFEDYVEEQMLGCKREVERIKLRIADWDKKISDWQVAWATAQTKKKAAEEVLFLIKYVLTAMYWGNNAPAE